MGFWDFLRPKSRFAQMAEEAHRKFKAEWNSPEAKAARKAKEKQEGAERQQRFEETVQKVLQEIAYRARRGDRHYSTECLPGDLVNYDRFVRRLRAEGIEVWTDEDWWNFKW